MNLGKATSKGATVSQGVRFDSSVYGSVVPVIIGRTRVAPKMIFSGNFLTKDTTGKKGGGKKGGKITTYTANFDWLLGYSPIRCIGSIWQNKDNFFQATLTAKTFNSGGTGPFDVSTPDFLGIVAITQLVNLNVLINDYGAPGSVHIVGGMEEIILPGGLGEQQGTFNGMPQVANIAPGGHNWADWTDKKSYSLFSGQGWRFDLNHTSATPSNPITVYFLAKLPPKPKKPPKTPMQAIGYEPEAILGSGSEYSFGGAPTAFRYPEFAGVGGVNVDMGSGNTAPNDNYEVFSLYGITPSGDANPADVMLDVLLLGNPLRLNNHPAGQFVWNHGVGFGVVLIPQGNPQFPNMLEDPPVLSDYR